MKKLSAVVAGLLSTIAPVVVSAQEIKLDLEPPTVLEPANKTATSLTVRWTGSPEEKAPKGDLAKFTTYFQMHVMHEYAVLQDGIQPVADVTINGGSESDPLVMTWLDQWCSQTGWFGGMLGASSNSIELMADKIPDYIPNEQIASACNINSPQLSLGANGGRFKFSFWANAVGSDAHMVIVSWADQTHPAGAPPTQFKEIVIKAGEPQLYTVDFAEGSWSTKISMQMKDRVRVSLSKFIRVEQEMKKGEGYYRSAFMGAIVGSHGDCITENPDEVDPFKRIHKVRLDSDDEPLDTRLLDEELAQVKGYSITLRVQNQMFDRDASGMVSVVHRSRYSEPYVLSAYTTSPPVFNPEEMPIFVEGRTVYAPESQMLRIYNAQGYLHHNGTLISGSYIVVVTYPNGQSVAHKLIIK